MHALRPRRGRRRPPPRVPAQTRGGEVRVSRGQWPRISRSFGVSPFVDRSVSGRSSVNAKRVIDSNAEFFNTGTWAGGT